MKVAIVYHFFAHYRKPVIDELSKSENIDFYFLGDDRTNQVFSSVKLHEFNTNQKFIRLKNRWIGKYFLWQTGLIGALKREKFDQVIFLGDWKYISTWIALLLFRNKVPCMFWGHGLLNRNRSWQNEVKLLFFNQFNAGGLLYDNRAKRILIERAYKKPLSVIYNSLDYKHQSVILSDLGNNTSSIYLPIESPYVIFSGRLIRERELEVLFDAINLLKKDNVRINALIVGNGPHLEGLKKYSQNLQLGTQVVFYGACYDERLLAEFYTNSLCLVFPGPIGLAAIHSLSYGVGVITNDRIEDHKPEFEAIIDDKTGFLFKKGEAESLALSILKVHNLSQEDKNDLKLNALNTIAGKYTPDNQAKLIRKTIMENVKTVKS